MFLINIGSIIDKLITKRPVLFMATRALPGLGNSDHDGIGFTTVTSYDVKTVTQMFHQYNKADVVDLCNTLNSIPWDTCF